MHSMATTYQELQQVAGFELGWGRGPDMGEREWEDDEQETIKNVLMAALSRFYYPDVDGRGFSHSWSFLKNPRATVHLETDNHEVDMPEDFGGLLGQPYVLDTNYMEFAITVSAEVRLKRASSPSASGRPMFCEIEPKRIKPGEPQGWRMVTWPKADQDYEVRIPYKILPQYLTGEKPYAYGGDNHAETLRAAVRASVENIVDGGPGPFEAQFMKRMATSISQDRELRPTKLGYNGDPGAGQDEGIRLRRFPTVVYTSGFGDRL